MERWILAIQLIFIWNFTFINATEFSQANYGNSPRIFNVNQVRQQQPPTSQQQLQQQQRSMPSPGTSARQSPFPAEAFPPPASPTASQFPPVPNPNAANPTTQYRLQRAASTPTATTQLPGNFNKYRNPPNIILASTSFFFFFFFITTNFDAGLSRRTNLRVELQNCVVLSEKSLFILRIPSSF